MSALTNNYRVLRPGNKIVLEPSSDGKPREELTVFANFRNGNTNTLVFDNGKPLFLTDGDSLESYRSFVTINEEMFEPDFEYFNK